MEILSFLSSNTILQYLSFIPLLVAAFIVWPKFADMHMPKWWHFTPFQFILFTTLISCGFYFGWDEFLKVYGVLFSAFASMFGVGLLISVMKDIVNRKYDPDLDSIGKKVVYYLVMLTVSLSFVFTPIGIVGYILKDQNEKDSKIEKDILVCKHSKLEELKASGSNKDFVENCEKLLHKII